MSDRYLGHALVETPWGHTSELKKRKLRPGSRTPHAAVVRSQLERLYAAVIAVASEKGFESTTVADVIDVCGVSRSDFYKHFGNKADCLTAAAGALLEPALTALSEVERSEDEAEAKAVFQRFVELVCTQPAAARICFVELHAAGEAGEAVADRGFEAMVELAIATSAALPAYERGSAELVRVLVGGIRKLLHTRLYRREEQELARLAPDLWRWLTSVRPPPKPLEPPRRQRVGAGPRFEGYTPAERIAHAVARVVAQKGYAAMSTNDIAAEAAISLSTFYDNFSDKHDAVLAALEMGGAQITASAVPAARREQDWQQGVRALYEGICAYFAAEPEMAQLVLVGVYGAGSQALARRDRVIDSLAEMLAPGFDANPDAPPVSAEAAAATVYALMREQLRQGGALSLAAMVPLATYVTLAGFVGPERACAVANGEGRRR